jgi:hypothetical protein
MAHRSNTKQRNSHRARKIAIALAKNVFKATNDLINNVERQTEKLSVAQRATRLFKRTYEG